MVKPAAQTCKSLRRIDEERNVCVTEMVSSEIANPEPSTLNENNLDCLRELTEEREGERGRERTGGVKALVKEERD